MQYLNPPLSRGPSGKTWPRWLSPCLERTSVRVMPWELSTFTTTFAASRGRVKLGHPVPLSNLSKDAKSGSPETTSDVEARFLVVPVFVGERTLGPVSLRDAVLLGSQLRDHFGVFPVGRHLRYSSLFCIEHSHRLLDRPITSGYRKDARIEALLYEILVGRRGAHRRERPKGAPGHSDNGRLSTPWREVILLSKGEKIVTGLAASVVATGLIVGCVKDSASDTRYPRFRVYSFDLRPSRTVRWAKIHYLREKNVPPSTFS